MPKAQSTIEVAVPPSLLMGVILDFARYPQFLPEMVESTVIRHEGDEWIVRYVVEVIRRLEYTLRLVRVDDHTLTWSLVEGVFKANNGGWTLEPLDGGTRTRATYALDLDVGMFVPGSVMKTLVGRNLPATLEAFKARAEALAAAATRP